jgi:hypothetical protein
LGIPTPQFTGEKELTLNTIQENMAVDNNLYVVVHTASDYVSSEQLKNKVVSSFILGDVMNCVYIVNVEAIHRPLFVFKNYGSSGDNATKLFCTLPQRRWGQYFSNKIQSVIGHGLMLLLSIAKWCNLLIANRRCMLVTNKHHRIF